MTEEYKKLTERKARLNEVIKRLERNQIEVQQDLAVLYAELQAVKLRIAALRTEGHQNR